MASKKKKKHAAMRGPIGHEARVATAAPGGGGLARRR